MPYFKTSQEWLDQTILLVEARPDSTRITAKHTIKPVKSRQNPSEVDASKPPRAHIVLKTYDPQSGVTLKYKTNKAAEVGRLMGASLGRAGRGMGGLGEEAVDVAMGEGAAAATATTAGAAGSTEGLSKSGGGGGGAEPGKKNKKKKGRK